MNNLNDSPPLMAYISATRIGHQLWEVIMHCSYANRLGRRLLIFFPPTVPNKAFHVLNSDTVRFFQLPSDCSELDVARDFGGMHFENSSYVRMDQDMGSRLFDELAALSPASASKAFSNYWIDCFDFRLPREHFQPLAVQSRYSEEGESLLRKMGLSEDGWFVCLHMREASFLGDPERSWMNQSFSNYLPAIEHITSLGGKVVRMGDPSMTPLPLMNGVIDYACGPHRSNFADIYLCQRAKFFISSQSGLFMLPTMLNTPLLSVNYYPVGALSFLPGMSIFKKVYSEKHGRLLSIREIFAEPTLCFRFLDEDYRIAGLRLVENSAEEILAAVREFLDLLADGTDFNAWSPEQLFFQREMSQALARTIHGNSGGGMILYPDGVCRIGSSYFRDHW